MTFGPPDHLTLYDRSLSGLPYTRLPSCYSDSEPDLFFSRQSPDLSLTTSGFSSRLQDPRLTCDRNLKWSIDWAVAYIVDHLEKRPEAADALRSIRIRAATFEHEGLTKDIPYRIFNKLNETLFASYLKDAVFLGSSSLGPEVSGVTYTHSWGPVTEVRRVSIILNSDVLDYARARDVVAILIHHMIHAYFLVACGPQKENEVDYGRLGHGYHFAKVMSTTRKVSAAHGKELTPLNFGHDLASLPSHEDIYYFPRRRSSLDDRENKEKWYCSHCHSNVYEIPESDIDKWYNQVCKPMMDQASKNIRAAEVQLYNDRRHELETKPRARLVSSAKSVEFIFQDKPVLVEGKKIDNFLAVRRAFENKKSRFLKIDKEVSEKTFHRFLEFIHTGTYRPDPYNLRAVAEGMGISSMGPPIIRPGGGRSEAWLLADVQFAKMGALMRFDECKAYALGRMNAYGIMTEDPIDVLKEIYSGYEPDSRLKEWARKFLIATSTPSPASSDYIGTRNITPSELPNLLKLESEQGPYRARLREAMDASGALENDVRKAWQELKNAGWMGYGTLSVPSTALLASNQLANLQYPPATPNLLSLSGLNHSPLQHALTAPLNYQQFVINNLAASPLTTLAHPALGNLNLDPNPLNSLLAPIIPSLNPNLISQNLLTSPFQSLSLNDSSATYPALDLDRLRALERIKIRNERENDKRGELAREMERERERDRLRETHAQVQAAAMLERFYGRGLEGYVLDDDEWY